MNKPHDVSQGKGEQHEELLHLSLDGLLPVAHTLVVNASLRTAILLSNDSTGAHVVAQQQFSPNGMRVLIPLLEAYPHYCSYEELLATLFDLSLEESRKLMQETREACIRTLRRTIGSIRAGLRAFGLKVSSLRGLGYLLKAL